MKPAAPQSRNIYDAQNNKTIVKGVVAGTFPMTLEAKEIYRDQKVATLALIPRRGGLPIRDAVVYSFTPYGFTDQKIKLLNTEQVKKDLHITIATSDIKINGEDAFASNYSEDSSTTEVDAAGALATAINLNTGVHGAVADAFNVVTSKAKGDFNMTTTFQINSNTVALASSYSELVSVSYTHLRAHET